MNFIEVSYLVAQAQCLTNLQVAMVSQFAIKASWCGCIFPLIRQWLLHMSPFCEMRQSTSLKTPALDDCCHVFYEWKLNAVLHKKLSLRSFHRKCCTIKDGAQTYDFIADKSCLLFTFILNILSGSEK